MYKLIILRYDKDNNVKQIVLKCKSYLTMVNHSKNVINNEIAKPIAYRGNKKISI